MGNIEYTYKNKIYPVNIIYKNNKNTYIRVDDNLNINITTNYLVSKKTLQKLLKDKEIKVNKMIDIKLSKLNKKSIMNNNTILLFGETINIVYSNSFNDTELINNIIYTKNINTLNKYLNKIITSTYKSHLDMYYHNFNERIPYPTLKIRKMKSRWGVCNYTKNIVTLNLELINYDISCLDYVIVHELSHFIYPNHSKNFWTIVEYYYPNYKEVRNILKKS